MPIITIHTNVETNKIDDKKMLAMDAKLQSFYEKPSWAPWAPMFIAVNGSCKIIFDGDCKTPVAFVRIQAPDLTPEKSKKVVAGLNDLIKDNLGVPNNRCFIEFIQWEKTTIGWKGAMLFPDG